MNLIADITLLVGILPSQVWARSIVANHSPKSLCIPWVVLGQFWHGAIRANHSEEQVRRFLSIGLAIIDQAPIVACYSKICASLQNQNNYKSIGQNDLWIAATSLDLDLPLVTRNIRHFDKIEGLKLEVLAE